MILAVVQVAVGALRFGCVVVFAAVVVVVFLGVVVAAVVAGLFSSFGGGVVARISSWACSSAVLWFVSAC
ncbi:hypothetical protein [Aureimonas jatrophae]|uniref:Uncharacterized protein n=1 Tax=Aureimonas jatrophae TaxID=1166073 RepID=A0A1H0EJK8_9HYPH|nr:hypothetical protein [Aureimonas jatrophae]SDN82608.1 hypothetical protein SAMN05192530_10273 [Aureimonas jatrophae]